MMHIQTFVFNMFRENTYVIWDDEKRAAVIDAGCYTEGEQQSLANFIDRHELKLVRILNTHLHLDHQFGNQFLHDRYGLEPEAREEDAFLPLHIAEAADYFGVPGVQNGYPVHVFFKPYDILAVGDISLKVLPTPGHTPGGCCLYSEADKVVFSGDTLFHGSVGRTDHDMPYGNYANLIDGIRRELLTLPDETTVLTGHGGPTTIGEERICNPFF